MKLPAMELKRKVTVCELPPSRNYQFLLTSLTADLVKARSTRLPLVLNGIIQGAGMHSCALQSPPLPSRLPGHQIIRHRLVFSPKATRTYSIASGRRKVVMVTASRQQQKSQSPLGVRAAAVVAGLALLITL